LKRRLRDVAAGNTEKSTHAAANTSSNCGATGPFSWSNCTRNAFDFDLVTRAATTVASRRIGMPEY
jgi:hypothetical protein